MNETEKGMPDELLTQEQAAAFLGNMRTGLLERWRMTGTGPEFVKLGKRVLYRRSALLKFLDERTHRKTPGRRLRAAC